MAVCRVEKNKNYTVMSNYHLRDMNLSCKAKGLLSIMLSLPEDWDYTVEGLAHICKDGIAAIKSAIIELEKFGYVERKRERTSGGTLGGMIYYIFEEPQKKDDPDTQEHKKQDVKSDIYNKEDKNDNNSFTSSNRSDENIDENNIRNTDSSPIVDFPTQVKSSKSPTVDFPTQEKPTVEKPTEENRRQLNKDILNTNIINTNIQNTEEEVSCIKNSSPLFTANNTQREKCAQMSSVTQIPSENDCEVFKKDQELNMVDVKHFYAYYSKNNWKDKGGNPVDWKYSMISWNDREKKIYNRKNKSTVNQNQKKINDFHNFVQREYSHKDYADLERKMLQRTFAALE